MMRSGGHRTGLPRGALLALAWFVVFAAAPRAFAAAVPAAGPESFLQELDRDGTLPGFRFRAGAFFSDNITHAPENELDELVGVAEFGANWHYVGTRFAAALDGTLAHRQYTENDFDDEGRANFLAVADAFIIPDTLDWYLTGKLANAPIDPLATTNPVNVQFVNVVETGPRLTLRPGEANELTVTASRAEIHAEESPIDHERDSAALGFHRGISANSRVGVVADARQVEFESGADAVGFDQREAHLTFDTRNDTLNLSFGAGRSRFELADGLEDDATTGWLRLRARRTSDSSINLTAERIASDTATAMLQDELLLEQGGVPTFIVTGDPFFADTALLQYTRGWRAHEWFVALNAREYDYFISPFDRTQRGVRLGGRFLLLPRLLLSVTAAGNDVEYLELARDDTVRLVETEADYSLDPNWSIVTGVRYLDRESSDPTYGFTETMITLFVSYSPARRRP